MKLILVLAFCLGVVFTNTIEKNGKDECDIGYNYYNGECIECGLTNFVPNVERIVGGITAIKGSWPAQVYIKQTANLPIFGLVTFACGGTLINPRTVLTAAHCITTEIQYFGSVINVELNNQFPTWESMFTIYAGLYDNSDVQGLETTVNDPNVVVAKVSKLIKHQSYNEDTMANDIALFILDREIKKTNYINYGCLPKSSTTYPGYDENVYAMGWGTTSEGGYTASILQNIQLLTYNPSYCSKVFPEFNKNWNTMICAGNFAGYQDTCQGDSGGGLMVSKIIDNKKKYFVSGIVSFGYGCARPEYPGIYTRTSYFIDWIEQHYDGSIPIGQAITIGISTKFLLLSVLLNLVFLL